MNVKDVLNEICFYKFEQEWFAFMENYDNDDEIG